MINTRKILWFLAVLSLVFLILEIGTTESKSLNQESVRLDSHSSGDNSIPEYLKDGEDDLSNGESSDEGSGDVLVKEKPKASAQSSVFADKQVNKLIQAQDLGKGENEGSGENAIPEFKEANDGSGEVIEMENRKDKDNEDKPQNLIEDFEKPASTIQSNQASNMVEEPTIITGGQDTAAVQPAAQVFNDASSATGTQTQSYNYAAAPSADQTQQDATQTAPTAQAYAPQTSSSEQFYNGASSQAAPDNQYYNDASSQATQAAQPATQTSSDASAQATSATAQYYNDAASQAAPAAQGVQAYAPEPQKEAEKVPQPVDVAMTANSPETTNYATGPAAQSSQVFNDANGVPQSVDAASMTAPQQQTQYYNSPAQQTMPQQTSANDLASSFMTNSNGASQQWDTTAAAAAQQPMQYTSNDAQSAQAYTNQAQNTQAYQEPINGVQQRKLDVLDENKFRTLVCQNNQDTIMCPQGKKINITDAHYGSMGLSSCQGPQTGNFLPIQPCETPDAYKIVKTSCDDMENCMLSANDGLFGDQCQSDKKYLDVTYSCEDNKEPAQTQQYMYPTAQPAYAPYQASPYGYPQQQQQQQQQFNDEPKINPPPPPKIPELMSTLVQLSKNKQKYGYLDDQQSSCSSCNKCSQCYKSSACGQCGFCQSKLCDQVAASTPMIPKNLRPLWEQWNERTADMNSMEMSALIFESPKKWLKQLHAATTAKGGSKRSHIKTHNKKTHKQVTKKHS